MTDDEKMYISDPLVDSLNDSPNRNYIMLGIIIGAVVGFTIGIIAASYLHKFIVHPLGF